MRSRHVVDGWLSGSHHNLDPGTSTEYSQHRQYVPGDDLRHVDWKAYGRTDRIYVKQFLDETNLACTFLLDASGSMSYRGSQSPFSKLQYAGCLVASLAWLLQQQGDAVGISINSAGRGGQAMHLPPASSQYQLTELIHRIENTSGSGSSEIALAMRDWGMRTDRRQLLTVVSDFFGDQAILHKSITDLRQFGHDILLLQVCDRDEVEFPFDRFTEFSGMETSQSVSLDADSIRDAYLQNFTKARQEIRELCNRSAIDFLPMVSDESLATGLGHFLMVRARPESRH